MRHGAEIRPGDHVYLTYDHGKTLDKYVGRVRSHDKHLANLDPPPEEADKVLSRVLLVEFLVCPDGNPPPAPPTP